MKKYILALDQGTTSSRAILFNRAGETVASAQKEFPQYYPEPGRVEHDAMEIWDSQVSVAKEVLRKAKAKAQQVAAIGITNQRETTMLWDKATGQPLYRAIVWQDRRTAAFCDKLKTAGHAKYIQEATGLVIDAYFSASKIHWLLKHVKGARAKARKGQVLFGTIDTWLLWKLSGGKIHATDATNASRTMLYNIKQSKWDPKLLKLFDIPMSMLPQVKPSIGVLGNTTKEWFGEAIPIAGVAGDQQASLFGQGCYRKGMAKNTYGTGCFMLMNTGSDMVYSKNGLLTTIALSWKGKVTYALEGSVFVAGAAIQWLRDGLKILDDAPDSEYHAGKYEDTGGVYVVPAFTGLGTPYWDMYARGAILGITRGTTRAHIIRATLESLAYQSKDVLMAMEKDAKIKLKSLRVDGGACANNLLMQFQADILGASVLRPVISETTALGAAHMAGLGVGFWKIKDLEKNRKTDRTFSPKMKPVLRKKKYAKWQEAVSRSMNWAIEK